jgi:oligopeptide transport system substrate-binding protein
VIINSEVGFIFTGSSQIEETDYTIEELTAVMMLAGLPVLDVTYDEISLKGGITAQRAIVNFEYEEIEDFIITTHLVLAQNDARTYVFSLTGADLMFDIFQSTIQDMYDSIELRSGQVYGLDRSKTLVLMGGDPYPEDLDPARTEGAAAGYIGHIFSGLVRLSPQMQIEPDLAESWTISPDGTEYTFTLRSGLTFQSGRPLTAEDVKFSWERAADPETDSPTARTYLGDILGLKEKLDGEAEEIEGVQVVDERTLVVTVDGPKSYFLAKLTYPTSFVVDRENVEADPEEWMFTPNASGPYALSEIKEDEAILFERNQAYYTLPPIQYIVYLLYRAGTNLSYYQAGEIDITWVSSTDVKRILDTPDDSLNDEMLSSNAMCTFYVVMSNNRPPLDDFDVRRALALAIDRDRINEVFYDDLGIPASSILPPGMPGHAPNPAFEGYDPEAALEALKASSYGEDLPTIVINDIGYGDSDDPYLTTLIDMWRESLGTEFTVEYVSPEEITTGLREADGHLVSTGWCADYPDPENFLDVLFHTDSTQNSANYSNTEVDALLEEARVELDPTRRLELYTQIESALLNDYAIAPLMHWVHYRLVNPRIEGFELPIGPPYVHLLSIVEVGGGE